MVHSEAIVWVHPATWPGSGLDSFGWSGGQAMNLHFLATGATESIGNRPDAGAEDVALQRPY